jgi:hypothetical protein
MPGAPEWREFFSNYSRFILQEAAIAESSRAEVFCVGLECPKTLGCTGEWNALIDSVRAVYHGALTYAAAGFDEAETVSFWNRLDFIGLNAYFNLCDTACPSREALAAGWAPYVERCRGLSERFGKKIVFTEAGYKSARLAAHNPWEWAERKAQPVDLDVQARCYDALLAACVDRPWFGGLYWWKFYTNPGAGGEKDDDFTPQHKPAEEVIRRWFARRTE